MKPLKTLQSTIRRSSLTFRCIMGRRRSASNKKMKNNKVVQDRLSSLPDEILIDILSRLPFFDSVATATLSRRWVSLWTRLTCIDIKRHDPYPNCNTSEFWTSFDNALPKFTSPFIERFCLILFHPYYQHQGCWSIIDSWARELRDRGVQHIEVRSSGSWGVNGRLVSLTTCVFQTRSLVSLDLGTSGSIVWRLPNKHDGYSIDLPNLKELSLVVDPSQHEQLEDLINSCPSLEDLSFTIIRPNHLKDQLRSDRSICVSSRVLKRLCITLYLSFALIIEAPELEDLIYEAPDVPNHDDEVLLAMLNSISHVKTLQLDTQIGVVSNLVKIIFPNMTRFTWTLHSSHDFEALVSIQICPCLEVFVLEFDYDCAALVPKDRTYTSILLAPVRRLELKTSYVRGKDEQLLKVARHLLASAPVLEEFVLGVAYNSTMDDRITESSELYRSLMKCPRRSSTCRIKVLGA